MRLEARPVRTDMPVTDTGTVKAEATIQRANLLRDAPMKANVTWERVQLGNLTRLIYGEDRGWRGALEASAQFSGTPGALHFTTAAKLHDFRRFDISRGDTANLNASCSGELNVSANLLQKTECHLPLDGGLLSAHGTLHGLRDPRYDLTLSVENLGADALLKLARRAKRDLPDDLAAKGTISASFHGSRMTDAPSTWIGNLDVNGLVVHSAVLGKDLAVSKAVAMVNTTQAIQPSAAQPFRGRPRPRFAPWWCIASTCLSAPALQPPSMEPSMTSASPCTSRETQPWNACNNLSAPLASARPNSPWPVLPQSIW